MDPEFLKALELVAEYDRNRPKVYKEYRIYYRADGTVTGLWETDHPGGDYIVVDDPELFNRSNTQQLRVMDGKLIKLDQKVLMTSGLVKSTTGHRVVRGHAALALDSTEEYNDVEYYDRKTDS